jgi:hypothetical protein
VCRRQPRRRLARHRRPRRPPRARRAGNEPQGCGFYCPAPGVANIDSYFELYTATATGIKSVDAQLSVGGPATAGLGWVDDFVERTAGGAMPADFLSSHSYPSDYRHNLSALNRTIFEDNVI